LLNGKPATPNNGDEMCRHLLILDEFRRVLSGPRVPQISCGVRLQACLNAKDVSLERLTYVTP
jgi:hypothetical protein